MFWFIIFVLIGLNVGVYYMVIRDVLEEKHAQNHWRPKAFEEKRRYFYARLRLAYIFGVWISTFFSLFFALTLF